MRIYSVAFFGHRYVDNIIKVENLLEEQIRKLIDENEYVDFLVGRNGDFDQCVYAEQNGYELDITDSRYHHEIYLSDPRKCEPAKLKTVARHPIKRGCYGE